MGQIAERIQQGAGVGDRFLPVIPDVSTPFQILRRPESPTIIFSKDTPALLASIQERATGIAQTVRVKGQKRMFSEVSEACATLRDGREVYMVETTNEAGVPQELDITIPASRQSRLRTDIVYNLAESKVDTYLIREPTGHLLTAYWVEDQPENGTRYPPDLTLEGIAKPVDELLSMIDSVSDTIRWINHEMGSPAG